MDVDQALAIAQEVCEAFNVSPAGDRPKFASLLDDVLDCLPENSMNWPEALRDRLGLGHYHVDALPISVALFRYPVSSVLQRKLQGSGITHRLAVPTALDGKLSPYFHPAPGDISPSFGRIVDLSHDQNCERQNAEILHLVGGSAGVAAFGLNQPEPPRPPERALPPGGLASRLPAMPRPPLQARIAACSGGLSRGAAPPNTPRPLPPNTPTPPPRRDPLPILLICSRIFLSSRSSRRSRFSNSLSSPS